VGLIGAAAQAPPTATDGDADEQVCGRVLGRKKDMAVSQTMTAGISPVPVIVENACRARYRYLAVTARLAADVTALSEAVTMFESMPTPHSTRRRVVPLR